MTAKRTPNEQDIATLYQARKQQHTAPAHLKRQILARAKKRERQILGGATGQRMGFWLGIAATCCLFVILIVNQQSHLTDNSSMQVRLIQLHGLSPQDLAMNTAGQHQEQVYDDYLKQKLTFSAHHQQAVLAKAADNWVITTCDNQIMQVTPGLMDWLVENQRVTLPSGNGAAVSVSLDNAGHIVAIVPLDQAPHC